jgi:putative membrane protein
MELIQKTDLRDALAAERTFLAWIRTGLALMGFGFVVARFGLFLKQFAPVQHARSVSFYGLSLWFGTALIAVGVLVFVLSAWHHIRLVRELNRGGVPPSRPSTQAVAIALFLAMVGLAMAIYLVSVRDSSNVHVQDNQEVSMTPTTAITGIVDKPSNHSVDETVALENLEMSEREPFILLS